MYRVMHRGARNGRGALNANEEIECQPQDRREEVIIQSKPFFNWFIAAQNCCEEVIRKEVPRTPVKLIGKKDCCEENVQPLKNITVEH